MAVPLEKPFSIDEMEDIQPAQEMNAMQGQEDMEQHGSRASSPELGGPRDKAIDVLARFYVEEYFNRQMLPLTVENAKHGLSSQDLHNELLEVLPTVPLLCSIETSVHVVRFFFGGRRLCDRTEQDEAKDWPAYRKIVLSAIVHEQQDRFLSSSYKQFTRLLRDTTTISKSSLPEFFKCWDAVALGVNSFNFTTVEVGECRCVPQPPGPVRRSYVPIGDHCDKGMGYGRVFHALENFFQPHRFPCSSCGGEASSTQLVLDRLPLFLMVQWPHDLSGVIMPWEIDQSHMVLNYTDAGRTAQSVTYAAVRAYIINNNVHTFPVLSQNSTAFIVKDSQAAARWAVYPTIEESIPESQGYRTIGVLLQRSI